MTRYTDPAWQPATRRRRRGWHGGEVSRRLHRDHVGQAVLEAWGELLLSAACRAGEIEGALFDQLRTVFRQPENVVDTWRTAHDQGLRGH